MQIAQLYRVPNPNPKRSAVPADFVNAPCIPVRIVGFVTDATDAYVEVCLFKRGEVPASATVLADWLSKDVVYTKLLASLEKNPLASIQWKQYLATNKEWFDL